MQGKCGFEDRVFWIFCKRLKIRVFRMSFRHLKRGRTSPIVISGLVPVIHGAKFATISALIAPRRTRGSMDCKDMSQRTVKLSDDFRVVVIYLNI